MGALCDPPSSDAMDPAEAEDTVESSEAGDTAEPELIEPDPVDEPEVAAAVAPAVVDEPATRETSEQPSEPVEHTPRPRRENGLADTAALLRELSSLGAETNDTPPPVNVPRQAAPPAPAPQGAGQHARKRKGLFGRG